MKKSFLILFAFLCVLSCEKDKPEESKVELLSINSVSQSIWLYVDLEAYLNNGGSNIQNQLINEQLKQNMPPLLIDFKEDSVCFSLQNANNDTNKICLKYRIEEGKTLVFFNQNINFKASGYIKESRLYTQLQNNDLRTMLKALNFENEIVFGYLKNGYVDFVFKPIKRST